MGKTSLVTFCEMLILILFWGSWKVPYFEMGEARVTVALLGTRVEKASMEQLMASEFRAKNRNDKIDKKSEDTMAA